MKTPEISHTLQSNSEAHASTKEEKQTYPSDIVSENNEAELKSNQSIRTTISSRTKIHATDLGEEVMFTFWAPSLGIAGAARQVTIDSIKEIFKDIDFNKCEKEAIKCDFVGGNASESSQKYFMELARALLTLDQNRKIFKFRSNSVGPRPHPGSVVFSCFSGFTSEYITNHMKIEPHLKKQWEHQAPTEVVETNIVR
jgi:hypothetical protein